MSDGGKAFDRLPADPLSGTIGCNQFWVFLLNLLQVLEKEIKVAVRNLGLGFDVIEIVVVLDEPAKLLGPLTRRRRTTLWGVLAHGLVAPGSRCEAAMAVRSFLRLRTRSSPMLSIANIAIAPSS